MAGPVLISKTGLIVLTWVMTAVAMAFTAGRFWIRYGGSGKFIASDYINGLACILLIGYQATYTANFNLYYAVEFYAAGTGPVVSDSELIVYFKTELAVSMLFWVIAYLVKASFLMLYFSLFRVSRRFMQAWWIVSVLTAFCFLISFIGILWECGYNPAHDLFKAEYCLGQNAITASVNVVKLQCALNVFSDFMIIFLPIYMLRTLQMTLLQKIGLSLIFAVALIDVAFDILRTVYTLGGGAVAIDTIWDILEPAIAVMVCAMPTYRNALTLCRKKRSSDKDETYYALEATRRKPHCATNSSAAKTFISSKQSSRPQRSIEDFNVVVERTYDVRVEEPRETKHIVYRFV